MIEHVNLEHSNRQQIWTDLVWYEKLASSMRMDGDRANGASSSTDIVNT